MNNKNKTTFSKARIETFYKFHFLKKSTYKFVELGMVLITFIISLLGITILENMYVFAICLVLGFVMVGTRNYRISSRVKSFLNKKCLFANSFGNSFLTLSNNKLSSIWTIFSV